MRFFASCFLLLAVAGCACEMSNLRNRHAAWVSYMNSQIGWSSAFWTRIGTHQKYEDNVKQGSYQIVQHEGVSAYKSMKSFNQYNGCSINLFISTSDLSIVGWEYAYGVNPSNCVQPEKNCAW
jgi:hypothetical protein